METIYKILREDYSEKHGIILKQSELAEKIGVSTATISRLERGTYKKTPPNETIEAYSKFFGVSRERILGTLKESEQLKDKSALESLGITEDVIKTFDSVKKTFGNDEYCSALITEFFSHPECVAIIFNSIFNSLKTRRFYELENKEIEEHFLNMYLGYIRDYVSKTIYPNIISKIDKSLKMEDEYYEVIANNLE